jgi:hypothetical protein
MGIIEKLMKTKRKIETKKFDFQIVSMKNEEHEKLKLKNNKMNTRIGKWHVVIGDEKYSRQLDFFGSERIRKYRSDFIRAGLIRKNCVTTKMRQLH